MNMDSIKNFYAILERRSKKSVGKFNKLIKKFYKFIDEKDTTKYIINGKNLILSKYHLHKCYTNKNTLPTNIFKEVITFVYDDVGINFKVANSYVKYIACMIEGRNFTFYIITKKSNRYSLTIMTYNEKSILSIESDTQDDELSRELIVSMRSMIECILIYSDSTIIKSELTNYRFEEYLVEIMNDICYNLY